MRVCALLLVVVGLLAANAGAAPGPSVRAVDAASSIRAHNLAGAGLRVRVAAARGVRAIRVDLVRVRGGRRVARTVVATDGHRVTRLRLRVRAAAALPGRGPYELRVQGRQGGVDRFSGRVVRRRLAVTAVPVPAPAPAPAPVPALVPAVSAPAVLPPARPVPDSAPAELARPSLRVDAVGDTCGAHCDQVAALIRARDPDRLLHAGDFQYENAGKDGKTFKAGYERLFAGLHDRTIPAFGGTHDTCDGTGAWECYPVSFFNAGGAPEVRGRLADHQWGYSTDLPNGWHVLVLNERVATPAQIAADLAGRGGQCVLALLHPTVYGSPSRNHPTNEAARYADALDAGGVDVIVNGHQHFYERNAYAQGQAFTVGTGSGAIYGRTAVAATAQAYESGDFGALELTLADGGWSSVFLTVGGAVVDPASGGCAD